MGKFQLLVPFVAILIMFFSSNCVADTLSVAFNATGFNWDLPTDNNNLYQEWANNAVIYDNDVLEFRYNASLHNVVAVATAEELSSCSYNDSTYLFYDQSGHTQLSFHAPSPSDFDIFIMSSWFAGDCTGGMKFQLSIKSTAAKSTAPADAPIPAEITSATGPTSGKAPEIITVIWQPRTSANWSTVDYPELTSLTENSYLQFQFEVPFTLYKVSTLAAFETCSNASDNKDKYVSLERIDVTIPGDYFFIDGNFTNCNSFNMKISWNVPFPVSGRTGSSGSSSTNHMGVIIPAVIGCLAAIAVGALVAYCCCKRRRYKRSHSVRLVAQNEMNPKKMRDSPEPSIHSTHKVTNVRLERQQSRNKCTIFSLAELSRATANFSKENELGTGRFGTVYKGTLDSGTVVAIRRTNNAGGHRMEHFVQEVAILSKVNDLNLVKLLGCCMEMGVPLLVYEFISNGTVEDHLIHSRMGRSNQLSWDIRFKIALQTAEALKYLHFVASPPIIHRDLKAANILLDEDFNAKVADFGLSKLVNMEATHVSTFERGTPGYLDPEYYQTFQLTDKTDVFSFGVVLLELITSKKPIDPGQGEGRQNLAVNCSRMIRKGRVREIIDPTLITGANSQEQIQVIEDVAQVAAACLMDRPSRPTMSQVVDQLHKLECWRTNSDTNYENEVRNDRMQFQCEMQENKGRNNQLQFPFQMRANLSARNMFMNNLSFNTASPSSYINSPSGLSEYGSPGTASSPVPSQTISLLMPR